MILHGVSCSAYTLRYGSYCAYGIASSSQPFFDLLRSFIRRVPWVVLTSHCVSPNAMLLIQYRSKHHLPQDCSPSLWRGCINTTVSSTSRCYGRKARLSLRAMAPSPSKKNSGLVNPRWRMYIDFLKKDSIDSRK